jgi:hypothetical protein
MAMHEPRCLGRLGRAEKGFASEGTRLLYEKRKGQKHFHSIPFKIVGTGLGAEDALGTSVHGRQAQCRCT